MDHTETTETRYSAAHTRSQAVFLGMRIDSKPEGIYTSVQPKGLGWSWLPRKFIDYSSCHTHYTKWYMFKGLLIRSLTICNNQPDFLKAAIHYAQGLVSRGFPAKSLLRAWSKFCYEKVTHPKARNNVMSQFKAWIADQDFSRSHPNEETQCRQRMVQTRRHFAQNLMCGFYAVNHILSALKLPKVTEAEIDNSAHEMAVRESSIIYAMDPTTVLDLAVDPRGNYAADTLLHLLHSHTGLSIERWRSEQPISSVVLLVGSGEHWQAVMMDKDKQWFILERDTKFAIQNVTRFLTSKLANGAVYEVGMLDELPNPPYLHNLSQPQRLHGEATRLHSNALTSPRKKKPRLHDTFYAASGVYFQLGPTANLASGENQQQGPPSDSNLRGIILPDDFQEHPVFNFEGPQQPPMPPLPPPPAKWFPEQEVPLPPDNWLAIAAGDDPMDVLIENLTPEEVTEESPEHPRRSSRTKNQPQLYQSAEVERQEKAAKTKGA